MKYIFLFLFFVTTLVCMDGAQTIIPSHNNIPRTQENGHVSLDLSGLMQKIGLLEEKNNALEKRVDEHEQVIARIINHLKPLRPALLELANNISQNRSSITQNRSYARDNHWKFVACGASLAVVASWAFTYCGC